MKQFYILSAILFLSIIQLNAQTLDAHFSPSNSGGGHFEVKPPAEYDWGTIETTVGQSFKALSTGEINQINLYYSTDATFIPGDFLLTIFAGSGYTGTEIGSHTFTLSTEPLNGEFEISLINLVSVVQGDTYTIKIETTTGNARFLAPDNLYVDGVLYYSSGSTFDSYDLWFKTFHATTLSNNDILDISKEIELYPNPTNNKAFINTQFNGEFSVYNILGEKLISFTTKAGIQREIDLTNLTDGVYIIREQKGAMKKLIVKK